MQSNPPASTAQGQVYTVTSASRALDPDDGVLTLGEAANAINDTPGHDTIRFDPALAGKTVEVLGPIIGSPVTIEGPSAGRIVVDSRFDQVFQVDDSDAGNEINVTIKNLTLTGGGGISGGGILNRENLTLDNVAVRENFADTGAGIANEGGTLTLRDSVVADNQANAGNAGGIGNFVFDGRNPSMEIINSDIIGNTGTGITNSGVLTTRGAYIADNEAESQGAGIFQAVGASGGSMTLVNTTIANNSTTNFNVGGGISGNGSIKAYNTSIVGNDSNWNVGGVHIADSAEFYNSTIAGNEVVDGPERLTGGRDIANLDGRSVLLANTIVADGKGGAEISGGLGVSLAGKNVVQGGLPSGPNPKVLEGNPALAPLADRGGDVPVRLPTQGSNAVNTGQKGGRGADVVDLDGDDDTGETMPFEARGAGFDRVSGGKVDIGAAERGGASNVSGELEAELDAIPGAANVGVPVLLNAGDTTAGEATVTAYRWDFDGDGSLDTPEQTAATTTHVYNEAGPVSPTVHVTSSTGATATAEAAVRIRPEDGPDFQILDLSPAEQLTALYVGYFGRAPGPEGLSFWMGQYDRDRDFAKAPSQTLDDVAESFRLSDEAQALYPFLKPDAANSASRAEIESFLDDVYANLFDRAPSDAGRAFWADTTMERLQAGENVGDIIIDIISGASDRMDDIDGDGQAENLSDATTIANKIGVAADYTEGIDQDAFTKAEARTRLDGDFGDASAVLDRLDPTTVTGISGADAGDALLG